ncbi:MAG: NADPH-dependent FMN reductase [candidate division KSB1 bacterium]|nr:NADPH-dependent FMN reductase [candidate division KSB1 bacterium]
MNLTISLVYGSVRSERQGIRAAQYLHQKCRDRGLKVHFIDPLQEKLPFLDKMYKEFNPGEAPEPMQRLAGHFQASDGFLIVTGEYNHGLPPALKNILDHFQSEYLFKPSAIACYSAGRFGGVRAMVHLREVVGELGMPAISSILPFPSIAESIDTEGSLLNERIDKHTDRFLDEFVWYMEALKVKRERGVPF